MFFCTLEHEIFGTRISLTDFAFGTLNTRFFSHEIFLNTNNSNNTNIFWHTDLTLTDSLLLMFEHESYE